MATSRGIPGQDREKVSEPVSEFLRFLITRWEQDGKTLKSLAQAATLAQSMPSQIKARTSDASFYSAAKLAGPLGYTDLPELVTAAYAWWRSDRSEAPDTSATSASPVAEAMRLALSYAVTQEQIDRVMTRLPPEKYTHKDALWWLARFHEERSLDAEQAANRRAREAAPSIALPPKAKRTRPARAVDGASSSVPPGSRKANG